MLTFKAMNTQFLIEGFSPQHSLIIKELAVKYENIFSRFDPLSEISTLNNKNSPHQKYSLDMLNCIEAGVELYKITKGIFNPFVGRNINQMGYDTSFEKLKEKQASNFNQGCLALQYSEDCVPIRIDKENSYLSLDSNVSIDLGGFAKGWAGEQLSIQAKTQGYTNGLIDAGGDIKAWGMHPNGHPWLIGVSDPFNELNDAFEIFLDKDVCIATSSTLKRRWKTFDGGYNNHIIDPRTGISTNSDIIQVSVFSENLCISEAFAKLIIVEGILGITKYTKLFDDKKIAFIAFTKSGDILKNQYLEKYCNERRCEI